MERQGTISGNPPHVELTDEEFMNLLFFICVTVEQRPVRLIEDLPEELKYKHRSFTAGILCPIQGKWYLADDWHQMLANRKFYKKSGYTKDWKQKAEEAKVAAGYRCEQCGEDCRPETKRVLTVHHINRDKQDNSRHNLVALCWDCHRMAQRDFVLGETWRHPLLEAVAPWFKSFYEEYPWAETRGYYCSASGLILRREG